MTVEEAIALTPPGWTLSSFSATTGVCRFTRGQHILGLSQQGDWSCTARTYDDRDIDSKPCRTAQEAIDQCRYVLNLRRERLFNALRDCK